MEAGRACREDGRLQQLRRCAARFLESSRGELRRPPPAPATGHDKPSAVIVVKFDDGKKEERVVFGTSGAGVFATRADQPGALKLEAGKYQDAVKKLDAIQ